MAFVLSDRIKETTTTTGTGTYTLGGAVSGFETFTANLSNSDTTYYCCTDGTDFEVGLGTFTSSGTTLARTTIISSSNSNNAVSWSSGTRDIFCTLPGSKAVFKDGSDNINGTFVGNITGNVTGNASGTAATVTGAAQSNITSVGTLTGLTTSGTINLSQSSGIAIKTTGSLGTADLTLLRAGINTNSADYGFDIKYMGSRSGNNNSYSLFMHNQQGTDVEAMTVLQDGKVGINNTSPSAPLDVSGDAEITGTLTAGEVSATTLDIGGTNITATATELNILDGVTATTSELNIMDGVTSTTAELNILDGVTATATEINKLDGVTATTTELNYVDVTTLGTVQASKAVTADANGDVLFPDDEILKFGDSGDLTIQHNGSHSVIKDGGTGNLELAGSVVAIKNGARTENGIVFTQDGSVDLYHDNSKKFETTSDGATVTGTLTSNEFKYADSNVKLVSADYTGTASGSYLSANEIQEILSITPDGNSENYSIFGTIVSASGANVHTLNINANLRSNTLPDLSFSATYNEELSVADASYLTPILFTKETSTASMKLCVKVSQTIYGRLTANLVIIARNSNDLGNITVNTTEASEFTGTPTGFTEQAFTRTYVVNGGSYGLQNSNTTKIEATSNGATVTGDLTTTADIELGHASDTTIARSSAGVVTIEGNTIITTGNSDTPSTTTSSSDADFVLVDDGGTMKKITPANLGITSGSASKGFAVAMAIAL